MYIGNVLFFESIHCYLSVCMYRIRKEIWKNYWIKEEQCLKPPIESLLDISIEQIFSSGINFFNEEIPESLKHYMSFIYLNYNICNNCNIATECSKPGKLIHDLMWIL